MAFDALCFIPPQNIKTKTQIVTRIKTKEFEDVDSEVRLLQ